LNSKPYPRRCCRQVGIFGIVHPEVLGAFGVDFPVSALELTIEPFCFDTDLQMLHDMHGWDLVH
jgi:phenylalanyl-tRNA synthetase beta subunit